MSKIMWYALIKGMINGLAEKYKIEKEDVEELLNQFEKVKEFADIGGIK